MWHVKTFDNQEHYAKSYPRDDSDDEENTEFEYKKIQKNIFIYKGFINFNFCECAIHKQIEKKLFFPQLSRCSYFYKRYYYPDCQVNNIYIIYIYIYIATCVNNTAPCNI